MLSATPATRRTAAERDSEALELGRLTSRQGQVHAYLTSRTLRRYPAKALMYVSLHRHSSCSPNDFDP